MDSNKDKKRKGLKKTNQNMSRQRRNQTFWIQNDLRWRLRELWCGGIDRSWFECNLIGFASGRLITREGYRPTRSLSMTLNWPKSLFSNRTECYWIVVQPRLRVSSRTHSESSRAPQCGTSTDHNVTQRAANRKIALRRKRVTLRNATAGIQHRQLARRCVLQSIAHCRRVISGWFVAGAAFWSGAQHMTAAVHHVAQVVTCGQQRHQRLRSSNWNSDKNFDFIAVYLSRDVDDILNLNIISHITIVIQYNNMSFQTNRGSEFLSTRDIEVWSGAALIAC
jgi:hypothetical protein